MKNPSTCYSRWIGLPFLDVFTSPPVILRTSQVPSPQLLFIPTANLRTPNSSDQSFRVIDLDIGKKSYTLVPQISSACAYWARAKY